MSEYGILPGYPVFDSNKYLDRMKKKGVLLIFIQLISGHGLSAGRALRSCSNSCFLSLTLVFTLHGLQYSWNNQRCWRLGATTALALGYPVVCTAQFHTGDDRSARVRELSGFIALTTTTHSVCILQKFVICLVVSTRRRALLYMRSCCIDVCLVRLSRVVCSSDPVRDDSPACEPQEEIWRQVGSSDCKLRAFFCWAILAYILLLVD